MLKAAIEKILELAPAATYQINGETYSDHPLNRVERYVDRPNVFQLSGLDGVAKLIRKEMPSFCGGPLLIRVTDHCRVDVFTSYRADYSRDCIYSAHADVPFFRDGFRDRESALIELRSQFLPGTGVDYLLELLAKTSKESNVSTEDNGVTQTVEARQGIALNAKVVIKPRVALAPYRTFLEVAQPESEFLLRVDDEGRVGFFEADGGMWKLRAKDAIAAYFESELADLIEAGNVTVLK